MGSGGKREKHSRAGNKSHKSKTLKPKNPSGKRKHRSSLAPKSNPSKPNNKKKQKTKNTPNTNTNTNTNGVDTKNKNSETIKNQNQITSSSILPAAEQLRFFLDRCRSSDGARLSSLELDSVNDTSIIELSQDLEQNADNLVEHMKAAFGSSWKESLCEKQSLEGKIEPGNPALVVISLSALRSLELHRGLRPLTRECPAAKLFSKHMKIEEQISFLKNHVNIACGTPSRIKKLIDMEVLGLKRLKVIVLDMHTDVKGYSLFTLPQIREEFWELYRSCFHQRVLQGDLRVCLYGPVPVMIEGKKSSS